MMRTWHREMHCHVNVSSRSIVFMMLISYHIERVHCCCYEEITHAGIRCCYHEEMLVKNILSRWVTSTRYRAAKCHTLSVTVTQFFTFFTRIFPHSMNYFFNDNPPPPSTIWIGGQNVPVDPPFPPGRLTQVIFWTLAAL